MDAKDILRIVLFIVIAIFALREFSFFKMRNLTQLNTEEEEEEEKASQQFQQQSQYKSNSIYKEQMEYENELSEIKQVKV